MDEARLRSLLERFASLRILVVGDYFLDRYLILDPALAEVSLETGRTAHQVVAIRNSPGAAGTVTNNLCALGVHVSALSIIGQDGMGYELLRSLQANGVDTSAMISSSDRFTPTYTKPMERQPDGSERETKRQDIKNRSVTPEGLQARLIVALELLAPQVDGIIVADQVPEEDCGTVTATVRASLGALAAEHPDFPIAVDSRVRIGAYQQQILKPNEREAWSAVHGAPPENPPTLDESAACGLALHRRTCRPVFLTVGDRGILVIAGGEVTHVPAPTVSGPIDTVGAGDSAMAAIAAALCAGATPVEAATIANLVASITIQQLGTTGTATREQVLAHFREVNPMIRTLYRAPDGTLETNMTPEQALAALRKGEGGLLWVDLVEESIASAEQILHDIFQFHPLAVDDALRETHVPKIDDWTDYVYITLHSVTHEPDSWEALDTLEVDLFVGRGYVVTYESRLVASVERVWSMAQRDPRHMARGAENLLYLLADELVSDYFPVVEDLDDALDRLEDDLLADPQQEEMERIFRLKRALAHLRRVIAPLREVMSRLSRNSYPVLDPRSGVFYRDVYDHLVRLYDITESMRDLLSGTLDIYLSVVNNRMNQIMKVLTMVSTLVMPLTFITGFFGMNFFAPVTDLHQWTGRSALIVTLVLIAGVPGAMYLWMRKRAWM